SVVLNPFPTRRSSDLPGRRRARVEGRPGPAGRPPDGWAGQPAPGDPARRARGGAVANGGIPGLAPRRAVAAGAVVGPIRGEPARSEEHTSELQSRENL